MPDKETRKGSLERIVVWMSLSNSRGVGGIGCEGRGDIGVRFDPSTPFDKLRDQAQDTASSTNLGVGRSMSFACPFVIPAQAGIQRTPSSSQRHITQGGAFTFPLTPGSGPGQALALSLQGKRGWKPHAGPVSNRCAPEELWLQAQRAMSSAVHSGTPIHGAPFFSFASRPRYVDSAR